MDDALHMLSRQFRRRLIWAQAARVLAQASLMITITCLAATLVQRITGAPLFMPAAIVSAVAATVWIILGLRHRPTLAAAALEIDRQRNLHELLSSAILSDEHEGFGACILAAAAGKAETVRLESLSTGGHGARAWIATLLLAGLLPLVYRSPSNVAEATITADLEPAAMAEDHLPTAARSPDRQPAPLPQGRTPGASVITVSTPAEPRDDATASPHAPRPTRSETAGVSAGGGLAQGSPSTPPALPAPPAPPPMVTSAQGEPGSGDASGSGRADLHASGTSTGTGQVETAGGQGGSEGGATIHARSDGKLDAQSLPEGYRDVLKAYFAR